MMNPAIVPLATGIVKMIADWLKDRRELRKHKITQLCIIIAAIIAALPQIVIAIIKSRNKE